MQKPIDELVFLVEESPEGGYIARAMGFSIVTEANDLESLKLQILDAVTCHFGEEITRPRLVRLHLVKDEVFAL